MSGGCEWRQPSCASLAQLKTEVDQQQSKCKQPQGFYIEQPSQVPEDGQCVQVSPKNGGDQHDPILSLAEARHFHFQGINIGYQEQQQPHARHD